MDKKENIEIVVTKLIIPLITAVLVLTIEFFMIIHHSEALLITGIIVFLYAVQSILYLKYIVLKGVKII